MRKAIIISGLLRLAEKTYESLNLISSEYDVFICTNLSEKEKLANLKNVKAIRYIESDAYLYNEHKMLLELPEGSKILQWQKLLVAFSLLQKFEDELGFRYDCVYKLRTDLVFDREFEFDFNLHRENENIVYMNSDIYFGGHRKVMELCSKFYLYALTHFYNSNAYFPFDIRLLKYSDLAAGKFEWLNYPVEIAGGYSNFLEFIKTAKSFEFISSDFSGNTVNYRKSSSKIVFPSEPAFLNYILANNFAVRSIHTTPFRIDQDRHTNGTMTRFYDNVLAAYKNSDFDEMLCLHKNAKAMEDRCADLYRDAALVAFKNDHSLGLSLINCAVSIRPGGPYIRKIRSDFDAIVLSKKFESVK